MFITDGVNATVLTPRSIKVTWIAFNTPCVTGYLISYFTNASYTCSGSEIVNDVSQTNHILFNLEEYTKYNIIVHVISNKGTSYNSNGVTVTTYTDSKCDIFMKMSLLSYYEAPSAPPQNVTVTSITRTSINITWEPPPEIHQNGQITGYYIKYYCSRRNKYFAKNSTTVTAATTSCIIKGLTPFVSYVIIIAAINSNGLGKVFELVHVYARDSK